MHIALIGMPGAGKSTVGRRLAEVLGYRFLDPDKVLEAAHGRPLQEVLDLLGPEAFLRVEERAVIACAGVGEPCVIAPGGSVVYGEAAMRALQAGSVVVYLDAPLSTLEVRIGGKPRGIVGNKTLSDLHAERVPLYRAWARLRVDADAGVEEVVSRIRKSLPFSG